LPFQDKNPFARRESLSELEGQLRNCSSTLGD